MVWNGANDPMEHYADYEEDDEALTIREALAQIVGAFTAGVYCSNCGESVDDCDCIISKGRTALK